MSKYQEYKDKANQLDRLVEFLKKDNATVSTFTLANGLEILLDKESKQWKIL